MAKAPDHDGERLLEDLAKRMSDEMMKVLCGSGALSKPRPTALRLTAGGSFKVVELDDDGKPIEPCRLCGPVLLCSKHMGLVP